MRLDELLRAVPDEQVVGDPAVVEVTSVVHDSRSVTDGALFCCVPAASVDGHEFAAGAVDAGAVALLCERAPALDGRQVQSSSETRAAMGPIAAAFHGDPSRALDVVGVTGTNGKTTTTHLLAIDPRGRRSTGRGHRHAHGGAHDARSHGAASAVGGLRDEGIKAVAMEVSSHALAQHRVDGTWFRVGVFTNLSRDHLDFHHTLDDYFAAKASLFTPDRCATAVVNIDDPWGRRLAEQLTIPWQPYSLDLVEDIEIHADWSRCIWEGVELRVPLGGRFNLMNALTAAVTAQTLGISPAVIAEGLSQVGPVAGRFEPVDAGQPFHVFVDYAHTPDGLEQLLIAAREIAGQGQVLVVFGAGGDRDRTKRAPDGRGGRPAGRSGGAHLGQSEERGSVGHHRRRARRHRRPLPRDRRARPPRRDRRRDQPARTRATSSSSPARATRPRRSPGTSSSRSTIASSRASSWRRGRGRPPDRRGREHGGVAHRHPLSHRRAPPSRDRPADPRGRARRSSEEGGHAHDGRRGDRARRAHRLHRRPLPPRRDLHVHRARGDGGHRRRRTRRPARRLDQGHARAQPRIEQAGQEPRTARGRGRVRVSSPSSRRRCTRRSRSRASTCPASSSAPSVGGPRRGDDPRDVERREPHRRPRRARRGLVDLRVHLVHGHRLLGFPAQRGRRHRSGHLPPGALVRPRHRRGRDARRLRRVPLVERQPGASSWATPARSPSAPAWPRWRS